MPPIKREVTTKNGKKYVKRAKVQRLITSIKRLLYSFQNILFLDFPHIVYAFCFDFVKILLKTKSVNLKNNVIRLKK